MARERYLLNAGEVPSMTMRSNWSRQRTREKLVVLPQAPFAGGHYSRCHGRKPDPTLVSQGWGRLHHLRLLL